MKTLFCVACRQIKTLDYFRPSARKGVRCRACDALWRKTLRRELARKEAA